MLRQRLSSTGRFATGKGPCAYICVGVRQMLTAAHTHTRTHAHILFLVFFSLFFSLLSLPH